MKMSRCAWAMHPLLEYTSSDRRGGIQDWLNLKGPYSNKWRCCKLFRKYMSFADVESIFLWCYIRTFVELLQSEMAQWIVGIYPSSLEVALAAICNISLDFILSLIQQIWCSGYIGLRSAFIGRNWLVRIDAGDVTLKRPLCGVRCGCVLGFFSLVRNSCSY